MVKFHVGTSGFGYREWKGKFYPDAISQKEMLPFYSARFNAVEINSSFYRMPDERTVEDWADQVPQGFVFAFKAPRFITHVRKLNDVRGDVRRFLDVTSTAGEKSRALLFQLPPSFRKDTEALRSFLGLVPPTAPVAFEFRHPSWMDDETFGLLRERDYALCTADTDDKPAEGPISTASWGYLRLRRAVYSDAQLAAWAEKTAKTGWTEAFVFFKHEESANGPEFAARFSELAKQEISLR